VTTVDNISAIGKEYQTPYTPKKLGRIRIKGIRKKPCLVKLSKSAGMAFPIA
jgi:hypothetical protein